MTESNTSTSEQPTGPDTPLGNPETIVLEALRMAYAQTGAGQYLGVYEQLRGRMAQRHAPSGQRVSDFAPAAQPTEAIRIRVVCATREDREGFFSSTALGRSLSLHRPPAVEVRLFPRNTQGLPVVYNLAIAESARDPVVMVFVHDDVHLCDFHWAQSLRRGLGRFDIVGLAGNRRRVPRQPGWLFLDEKLTRDQRANLSGTVAHGRGYPPETVDVFGPSGERVALLDGLFLAARSETLHAKSLRFDERFDFHFYDLDFCRQAERMGLTMGTSPISVIHQSAGNFTTAGWQAGYERYLEKWGD